MAISVDTFNLNFKVKDLGVDGFMKQSIKNLSTMSTSFNNSQKILDSFSNKSMKGLLKQFESLANFTKEDLLKKGMTDPRSILSAFKKSTDFLDPRASERATKALEILSKQIEAKVLEIQEAQQRVVDAGLNEPLRALEESRLKNLEEEFGNLTRTNTLRAAIISKDFRQAGNALEAYGEDLEKLAKNTRTVSPLHSHFTKEFKKLLVDYKTGQISLGKYVKEFYKLKKSEIFNEVIASFGKFSVVLKALGGATTLASSFMKMFHKTLFEIGKEVISFSADLILTFIPTLTKVSKAFIAVSDELSVLGNDFLQMTTEQKNFTTSMEANLQHLEEAGRKYGANAGKLGRDLYKFSSNVTGMADTMNRSANEASDAILGFEIAGKQFEAIGIKSSKQLLKLADVTGVSAIEYAESLKKLSKLGIKTDNLDSLIGAFVDFGRETHDIGKAMGLLPEIIDQITRKAGLMGMQLDPKQLADFGKQTAVLGRQFYLATGDAEKSSTIAKSIADSMLTSQKSFGEMFSGINNNLPSTIEALAVGFGDIGISMKSMLKQGPAEAVSALAKITREAKKMGIATEENYRFMADYLREAFGEEQGNAILRIMQMSDDAALKSLEDTTKASQSLAKTAQQGFSIGRTLAENVERMQQQFEMAFRRYAKKDVLEFVEQGGAALRSVQGQLDKLVADGGPLGKMIVKFSEIHHLGALSLVPKTLRPMAWALGNVVKNLMPTIEAFKTLGISIGDILSPLGLITASITGLGTWFYILREEGKSTSEAIVHMGNKIAEVMEEIPAYIEAGTQWVADFFDSIASSLTQSAETFKADNTLSKLGKAFEKAAKSLWGLFSGIGNGIFKAITSGFDPTKASGLTSAERIGGHLGNLLIKAWEFAKEIWNTTLYPFIKNIGSGIYDQIQGVVDPNSAESQTASYLIGTNLGKVVNGAMDIFMSGLSFVWKQVKDFGIGLISNLFGTVDQASEEYNTSSTAEKLGVKAGQFISDAFDFAISKAKSLLEDDPVKAGMMVALAGGGLTGLALGLITTTGSVIGKEIRQATGGASASEMQAIEKEITKVFDQLGKATNQSADTLIAKQQEAQKKIAIAFTKEIGNNSTLYFDTELDKNSATDKIRIATEASKRVQEIYNLMGSKVDESVSRTLRLEQKLGSDHTLVKASKITRDKLIRESTVFLGQLDEVVEKYQTLTGMSTKASLDKVRSAIEEGNFSMIESQLDMIAKQQGVVFAETTKTTDFIQDQATKANTAIVSVSDSFMASVRQGIQDLLQGKLPEAFTDVVKKAETTFNKFNIFKKKDEKLGTGFIDVKSNIDEKELKYNKDIVLRAASEVATKLDQPLLASVQIVLSKAFDESYKQISKGTDLFVKSLVVKFKDLGVQIKDSMAEIWKKIVEASSEALSRLTADSIRIQEKVDKILSAIQSSAAAKVIVKREETGKELVTEANDAAIVNAINYPKYKEEEQAMFELKLNKIADILDDMRSELRKQNSKTSTMKTLGTSLGTKSNR